MILNNYSKRKRRIRREQPAVAGGISIDQLTVTFTGLRGFLH